MMLGRSGPPEHPARILVVEDQHPVREAVAELLGLVGHDVLQADRLGSAVDQLEKVELVLLDLHLPDGDGLDLLALVRELSLPPEVVVTTGYGTVDNAVQALHAGAFAFLVKPVQPDDLLMMVGRAISAYRTRQDLLFHRDILQSVRDVVIAVDDEDRIVFFNEGARVALLHGPGELVGRPAAEFLSAAPVRGIESDGEFRLFLPDGSTGVVQGGWSDVRDTHGRGRARVLVGRDLTRERLLQRDLVSRGALAWLGMMVSEIAHDINNPSTYLVANLTALRADLEAGTLDPIVAHEMISECLEGMDRIARDVRRIGTVVRSQVDREPTLLDLAELVRGSCRLAGLDSELLHALRLDLPHGVFVHGDGARLSNVVVKLVRTAREAIRGQESPAPWLEVRVHPDATGDLAVIDVRDNGPGISESLRLSLFQSYALDEGVGADPVEQDLGLAAARSVVVAHGGTIALVEHERRGGWFRVTLPRVRLSEGQEPEAGAPAGS